MKHPLPSPWVAVIGRCLALLTVLGSILAAASRAMAQCAMCSGAADASSGQFAYSKSTLFMISVPYLLLAGVAGYVVHAFRKADDATEVREGEGPDPGGD
jgi:hypothetical protein